MDLDEKAGLHIEVSSESSDDVSTSAADKTFTSPEDPSHSSSSGNNFAGAETRAVNNSKRVVYLAILLAAIGMAAATYVFTHKGEKDDFEHGFTSFADEIATVANKNARRVTDYMHGMATSMTSYAVATNSTFPFITLPHFDIHAREADRISGTELILFAPIVHESEKVEWEKYTTENRDWIDSQLGHKADLKTTIESDYQYDDDVDVFYSDTSRNDIYVPIWEYGPDATSADAALVDLYAHPIFHRMVNDVLEVKHKLLSEVTNLQFIIRHTSLANREQIHPRSFVLQPILSSFEDDATVVGFFIAVIPWERFFANVLPNSVKMLVDVSETCGSSFDYLIDGKNVQFAGNHETREACEGEQCYISDFALFAAYDGQAMAKQNHCTYSLKIAPTKTFKSRYETSSPILYAGVVFLVFMFTAGVFFFYDIMVQRRQQKIVATAKRTTAIVTSLFPKEVGKRILEDAVEAAEKDEKRRGFMRNNKSEFVNVLEGGMQSIDKNTRSRPIADLFPEVTIMFADIVGFTAWSSMREPSQVFILLETIYREFDEIAKRRRVFKVETVGDCYVAVAGLPDPRKDHAVVMARFARDCLYKMSSLTKLLEVELGPDTTELTMRVGLHSGPVTAGVLRGERARFQLFGDTVNTTARMESTGARDKIHVSQETADLLVAAGKVHWVNKRPEKVLAKGKGELQTYWLDLRSDSSKASSANGTSESGSDEDRHHHNERVTAVPAVPSLEKNIFKPASLSPTLISDKQMRLVDWNTDMLVRLLKEIVARRDVSGVVADSPEQMHKLEFHKVRHSHNVVVLDEVKDIICLPKYNANTTELQQPAESIKLDNKITKQLRDYVQTVSAMYRDNAFHNFEHASHVTMSVVKLLSRIVAPAINVEEGCDALRTLHDHTYGITSDPLTQFSVILSALIHDVDHTGVSNNQLIKEQSSIATVYGGKSVAEQNSIDLAWGLLMEDCYEDLRRTIYSTEYEFKQFRQVVVNTVLATDIMDKELGVSRKARWNLAFAETSNQDSTSLNINRKATIVIEHLIQASDVAHTMQHWHIYRKWNARLFEEMYRAYKQGRAEKNPADFWYEGEIGFFDHYIIPLAMKLRSCGVFGVSSDECLTYARQNRQEWERKGQDVIAEIMEKLTAEY